MVEQETIKVSQLDENSNIQLSAKFLMTQDSKSYAVKYSSLQHKLSSQFDIVGINQRVQNNTTSINTLNTAVTQHTTSIENLTDTSNTHDENIQTISENVNSNSTRIGTAEANITEMSDNINRLSEDVSQINDTIDNDLNVVASSSKLGMVKCGFAETPSQKDYAVQVDTAGNMHVVVPWEGGSGGSGDYDDVRKTVQDISATTIPDIKFNITELSNSTVNTDYQRSLVNKLSLVEDQTDEIGNFIDEIIDKTSGLYNVGCIYMTTNDVNDTISNLSRIINVYNEETDEETPSEWEEVDTVLSDNGIHILKRTA